MLNNNQYSYILVYKPKNFISTTKQLPLNKSLFNILQIKDNTLTTVGRLDYDTEGALLVTNDKLLAGKLTDPSSFIPKIYEIKIKNIPSRSNLLKIHKGIYLEEGCSRSCYIEPISTTSSNTWIRIILTQGKNRQIKRIFWKINHPTLRIIRTHFGNLSIAGLKPGEYKTLSLNEIKDLYSITPH
ncbi:MAG: rRNA pseudouridine synthase [Deltaproteobacteria bacterium]|nr:MAG: rRNA pseudouridine synthase [Deltaproteobacteria bacterium]